MKQSKAIGQNISEDCVSVFLGEQKDEIWEEEILLMPPLVYPGVGSRDSIERKRRKM